MLFLSLVEKISLPIAKISFAFIVVKFLIGLTFISSFLYYKYTTNIFNYKILDINFDYIFL